MGAALSSLCTETMIVALLLAQWEARQAVLTKLAGRFARLVIFGAVMFGVMAALRGLVGPVLPVAPVVEGFGALFVAGLLYLALIWWGGAVAQDDRGFIRQVLISMPGGGLIERLWQQA